MGVGELLNLTNRLPIGLVKLTKTKRPFFLQSLTLVYVCRQIPDPLRINNAQRKDLEKLIVEIEAALQAGTTRKKTTEAQEIFEKAHQDLKKYLTTYDVRLIPLNTEWPGTEAGIMDKARQRDQEAEEQIVKIGGIVKEKLEGLKSAQLIQVPLQFWSDRPTSINRRKNNDRRGSEFKFNTVLLMQEIKIDEWATLDMLLHRFLEYVASNRPIQSMITISLIQHPQFYRVFPSKTEEFESEAGGRGGRIRSLDPWKTIRESLEEGGILQLILERKPGDKRELTLWNGSVIDIPDGYKNAWPLLDSEDTIVVRRRTTSFSLWLWPPPTDEASTTPIVPADPSPGNKSGSSRRQVDKLPQAHVSNTGQSQADDQMHLATKQGQAGQSYAAKSFEGSSRSANSPHQRPPAKKNAPAIVEDDMPTRDLQRPKTKRANDSERTLVNSEKPTPPESLPVNVSKGASPSAGHRPTLEHANSSSPTLVESSQPARVQPMSLPTFEGSLIQSNMTIGMSPVRGPKKKQGWLAWAKNKVGLE